MSSAGGRAGMRLTARQATDILVQRAPRCAARNEEERTKSWSTIRRWIPLIAWLAVIFGLSSIPQLSTDSFGLPEGFDKVVHFCEYLVLAILFRHGIRGGGQREAPVMLFVIATGLLVAGLDELYQSLIPGRHPSVFDIAADAVGILAGALAGARIMRRSEGGEQS